MVQYVNEKVVSREAFHSTNGKKGILESVVPITRRKRGSSTTFQFSDKLIAELPYCSTPNGIDLYHRGDIYDKDGRKVKNALLVLRIQKKSKTFYVRYKNKMGRSIGRWFNNITNKSHFKNNEATFNEATKRLAVYVRHQENKDLSQAHIADWSIADYLDRQYKTDRERYPIQNRRKKPVSNETIQSIKKNLGDKKLLRVRDVEKSWVTDLITEWSKERLNPANGIKGTMSVETQRSAYTMINSMFNICVKAGYIPVNPIRDEIWHFSNSINENREINTIDVNVDEALVFIFEKAPGSMQGKVLLASMMMAGLRNSEVYRNFTVNFRTEKMEIHIPADISHKHKKSRTVPVRNLYFWDRIKDYLASPEFLVANEQDAAGYLLPMKRKQTEKAREKNNGKAPHATDNIKRPVWNAFKKYFNIPKGTRPYDFRHTFITNLAERMGLHEVVQYSGNSIEMVQKHYAKVKMEKAVSVFEDFQSSSPQGTPSTKKHSESAENQSSKKESLDSFVKAMPDAVRQIWDMSAIKEPRNFVNRVRSLVENKLIDKNEVKVWLFMQ